MDAVFPPQKGASRPLSMKQPAGKTVAGNSHIYNGMRHARTDFSSNRMPYLFFYKATPESLNESMLQTDEDLLLFLYPSPLKERQKPLGNGKGSLQCAQCLTEMDAALIEHVWKAPCLGYVRALRDRGSRFPQRKRKDTGTPHRRFFPFQLL